LFSLVFGRILVRWAASARLSWTDWAWIAPSHCGLDELGREFFPRGLELVDTSVDFRQLAAVDGDRVRAGISCRMAGPQALPERARVFQRETHRL